VSSLQEIRQSGHGKIKTLYFILYFFSGLKTKMDDAEQVIKIPKNKKRLSFEEKRMCKIRFKGRLKNLTITQREQKVKIIIFMSFDVNLTSY